MFVIYQRKFVILRKLFLYQISDYQDIRAKLKRFFYSQMKLETSWNVNSMPKSFQSFILFIECVLLLKKIFKEKKIFKVILTFISGTWHPHGRDLARHLDVWRVVQPQLPHLPPGASGQARPSPGLWRDRFGLQVFVVRSPKEDLGKGRDEAPVLWLPRARCSQLTWWWAT